MPSSVPGGMDTRQAVRTARGVLTAAAPMLWIVLNRRSVANLCATPAGVDPNPPGAEVRPWLLVGDGFHATDAALERAILMRRSAAPGPGPRYG